MSANVDTMMFVGDTPWHGLGQKLENAATSAEAISAAKLDWDVVVKPLAAIMSDDEMIMLPSTRAVIRLDTKAALGTVGRIYTPVQNKEAFSFFDEIVGAGQAIYHVAGALGKGETIWILAKLPGVLRVGSSDDTIEKYLLLTNTHTGTTALKVFFTPIRVVCQNTLTMALQSRGEGGCFSVRHYPDVLKNVQQAQQILGLATKKFDVMEKLATSLAATPITTTWLNEYVETVFPAAPGTTASSRLKHIREQVTACFDAPSQMLPGVQGTAWAAYNAVTEFVDWKRKIAKSAKDPSLRLQSIWLGTAAQLKQTALEVAAHKIGAMALVN